MNRIIKRLSAKEAVIIVAMALGVIATTTYAGGHRGFSVSQSFGHSSHHASSLSGHSHYSTRSYSIGVARDSHGRIKRSSAARHEFMVESGYPHGRPGYVIDHIQPLKRGGADAPSNMQWQTKAEAKAKDKWE